MAYHSLHFHEIEVTGFRGRNFTLKMNPRGEHTVFVMDGNTGKTTLIELLRWCFKFNQENATDTFSHMYIDPSYVLDHNIIGKQNCSLQIVFSAYDETNVEHNFRFKREVRGEFVSGYGLTEDKLDSVVDVFDIDNGLKVFENIEAHDEMTKLFKLNECADYICFDGEKARDVMQLTSNAKKMESLLTLINKRITSYKIQYLKDTLLDLRKKVYSAAKSRMTPVAISRNEQDLNYWVGEQDKLQKNIHDIDMNISALDFNIKQYQDQYDRLENEIIASKQQNLRERLNLDNDLDTNKIGINNKRNELYKYSLNWINIDEELVDMINDIKLHIKETGKLPEPYREDLIEMCIENKKCIICGRDLEEHSEEYVKKLGKQIASDDVHQFLSKTLPVVDSRMDPTNTQMEINDLFEEIAIIKTKIESLNLTEDDIQKISNKDALKIKITNANKRKTEFEKERAIQNQNLTEISEEVTRLEERLDLLQENKLLLDLINNSLSKISIAEREVENKVIDIIGQVISEGVTSILGPNFAAKLSKEDGLMLGEDGHFGIGRGGYSGRLILSYCFAEAMTLIDPIIVDTPSGNIGSHRKALAEHLGENHKQVILLCLPTEIANFAPILNNDPIEILNEQEE